MSSRTALAALAACLLLLPSPARAAAAPGDAKARETFAALKRRLPGVVTEWATKSGHWDPKREATVALARRVAADRAKVVIVCKGLDGMGKPDPLYDDVVTLYLRHYDGAWTTTRYDTSWTPTVYGNKAVRFLMLAIDRSGGVDD
jgi:hypothetical protein